MDDININYTDTAMFDIFVISLGLAINFFCMYYLKIEYHICNLDIVNEMYLFGMTYLFNHKMNKLHISDITNLEFGPSINLVR